MNMQIAWLVKYLLCLGLFVILSASVSIATQEDEQEIDREALFGPGDRKHGYDAESYVTDSLSLQTRNGKQADLIKFANEPLLGLPNLKLPEDNPLTEEKINLGRRLFYDRRLSLNDTFSCAICHIPEQGFTNNEISTAIGVEGRSVKRNSPTMYNVAYYTTLFQDGREDTLEQQVWSPLLARNEMANPSIGAVINKIKAINDYDGLFEQAFNGKGPTMETVGMAFASYQRVLNAANSPFDRWYYGEESDALNADEKSGFELFTGKAQCSACHLIGEDNALFTDNQLHNTGHGFGVAMGDSSTTTRVQLAPGVFANIDNAIIESVRQTPKASDTGRYAVTQNPFDRWKFRTPILRNVALTAPYMHDGGLGSLREVIEFYNRGGIPNELLSPLIRPLSLSEEEIDQLLAFLNALTGSNVDILVADGFAAPIGEITHTDPNWAHETDLIKIKLREDSTEIKQ